MQSTPTEPPPYQIHQYPASLIDIRTLRCGQRLMLRPVLPQDGFLLGALMERLSPAARRQRFHGAVKLSAARLQQMSSIDYARQLALVVTAHVDGSERVIADARYCVGTDQTADFALVVDEQWHRRGIGAWALIALHQAATAAGVGALQGDVHCSNAAMLALTRHCGFDSSADVDDDQLVRVAARLGMPAAATPRKRPAAPAWRARLGRLFRQPPAPRLAP